MPPLPFPLPPLPTVQQAIFLAIAAFTALCSLTVVLNRNLFYSALALVATLFGVAGVYVLLEAEFLAVAQVLVYVGAIATLITFAIMLTRGIMFGTTSPVNRQVVTVSIVAVLFFLVMGGVLNSDVWPATAAILDVNEGMIAQLGWAFVSSYVAPFEMIGILLLVALVGAVMLARDDE